ncbi:MAG: hypothetical protein R3F39_00965 [Myxococcota bacterium]
MRAVGCAVVIIIGVILAYALGFGQGEKACISDCKREWCQPAELDPKETCDRENFSACRDLCTGAAADKK